MNIDPKIGLIIGVAVSIEQAIGIGAVNLTDAIPLAYIPIKLESQSSWLCAPSASDAPRSPKSTITRSPALRPGK